MLTEEQKMIGRRNFLKALAALPAVGAFAFAARQKAAHERPVRAGIIGTGSEGCVLLEQIGSIRPPVIEFKAAADIRPDNLKEGLDTIKKLWAAAPDAYPDDYRKLLERDDIEAVVIAAPLWMHAPVTINALKAGKHVFVEKMMAWSIEDARKMSQAARQANRILQVGHQRRANRLYASVFNMIRQGLIGNVYHVRTLWHRNTEWRRDLADIEPDLKKMSPHFDPSKWGYDSLDQLVNWRLYSKCSQGLMGELGSHMIDICSWILGANPKRVLASGGKYRYIKDRQVYDHIFVTLDYPKGPVSPTGTTVTFTSIQTNKFDHYYEQFMGEKGTIIITGEVDVMLFSEEGSEKATAVEIKKTPAGQPMMQASASRAADAAGGAVAVGGAPEGGFDRMEPYRKELEVFCQAIKFGTEVACTPQDGLAATVPSVAANEAVANGQPRDIDPKEYLV
jgi:predicted dehydrogenase